jgi:hypothetical protein
VRKDSDQPHLFLTDGVSGLSELEYNRIRAPHLLHTLINLLEDFTFRSESPAESVHEETQAENITPKPHEERQVIYIQRIQEAGLPLSYYPRNSLQSSFVLSQGLIGQLRQGWRELSRVVTLPRQSFDERNALRNPDIRTPLDLSRHNTRMADNIRNADSDCDLTFAVPSILPTSNTPHKSNTFDDGPSYDQGFDKYYEMDTQPTVANIAKTGVSKVNHNKRANVSNELPTESDTLKSIRKGPKTRLELQVKENKLKTPNTIRALANRLRKCPDIAGLGGQMYSRQMYKNVIKNNNSNRQAIDSKLMKTLYDAKNMLLADDLRRTSAASIES